MSRSKPPVFTDSLPAEELPTVLDPSILPEIDARETAAEKMKEYVDSFPSELLAGTGSNVETVRAATLREMTTGRGERFERKGVTFWAESPSLDVLDDFLEAAQKQASGEEKPFRALKAVACWLYYTCDTLNVGETGGDNVPHRVDAGRLATAAEIGRCFGAGDIARIIEDMRFYLGLTLSETDQGNA